MNDGDAGGDEKGSLLKQGMARRMAIFIGNHDNWLVFWNIFFPYIGNFIIPTDEVIFFRGVGIPPGNHDN
jgi:hypothetical protein